jgi:Tol biopolymer transport system component
MRTFLLLCGVAAVAAGLAGAAPPAPPAPRDTQPWWSPQGTTIAFQRESPPATGGDVLFTPAVRGDTADIIGAGRARGFRPGSGELLVDTGSATSVRDATDREIGKVPGTDATWSPDGLHVAFLAGDALTVSDPTGNDARPLATGITPPPSDVTGPVWSPDGTAIAIATGSAIEVVPVDGSAAHAAFDTAGENVNPSWSQDGTTIAFERRTNDRWAIWFVAPDGTAAHEAFGGAANNRFPQWSPVDGRLAFLSDRNGTYGLYVAGADGRAQELMAATAPDTPARWSPDATRLAVSSALDCKRFGIYVVRSTLPAQPALRSNQCLIEGGGGEDVIYGTPYYDRIDGNAGNDRLFGGNGDDVISGGSGNDGVGGGPGNDVISGGPGNDVLSGSTGNDVIDGGPGRDKIGCGPGNDTAVVTAGDTVRGCEHVRRKG